MVLCSLSTAKLQSSAPIACGHEAGDRNAQLGTTQAEQTQICKTVMACFVTDIQPASVRLLYKCLE